MRMKDIIRSGNTAATKYGTCWVMVAIRELPETAIMDTVVRHYMSNITQAETAATADMSAATG